ncbi:cytochrome c551 [Sporosarcina sp. YIM B06819]|uniref:cytochrome c551 n=1 Tax=Sporosarcina sp. YIM B06819 TaxID=3081769 RepID=UPI00298C38DD|nr:cytochrome c [Sporosarcina sp. YIM B06819]
MKRKLLAAIFGAVLVLGACGGNKAEKTPDTGGETATADAEAIVNKSCIACHGSNLEGQGNAPALNDVGARMSEAEIHAVIEKGQGGMPGGIIKGEEATAVAKWLAEKK